MGRYGNTPAQRGAIIIGEKVYPKFPYNNRRDKSHYDPPIKRNGYLGCFYQKRETWLGVSQ